MDGRRGTATMWVRLSPWWDVMNPLSRRALNPVAQVREYFESLGLDIWDAWSLDLTDVGVSLIH